MGGWVGGWVDGRADGRRTDGRTNVDLYICNSSGTIVLTFISLKFLQGTDSLAILLLLFF